MQKYFATPKPRPLKRFLPILRYIDEHLNERLTNRVLGDRLYLNEVYFSNLFKKTFGQPPVTYTIPLPYGMDGPIINLPAYLAGLPEEAYLSEFIPVITEEPEETVVIDDGMGLGDF